MSLMLLYVQYMPRNIMTTDLEFSSLEASRGSQRRPGRRWKRSWQLEWLNIFECHAP